MRQLRRYLELLKQSGVDVVPSLAVRGAAPQEDLPRSGTEGPWGGEWLAFRQRVLACSCCPELAEKRTQVVFGSGNPRAELVLVGEAPGAEEDRQGVPFVGAAGELLDKIIEAMGLARRDIFISNVLKCRPPGNRNPHPHEVANCEPYLIRQIELIQPRVICALGTFASRTLLKTDEPISRLRGRFHDYRGVRLMCTFHPAYLLRNPEDKRKVWEDMKVVRAELARQKVAVRC